MGSASLFKLYLRQEIVAESDLCSKSQKERRVMTVCHGGPGGFKEIEAHPMPGAQMTSSAHPSVEAPVCVCAPERHMMCFRLEDITPFSLRRLLLPQVRPLSRFGLVLPLFSRDCMHCCIQIHFRDLFFQDPCSDRPITVLRPSARSLTGARHVFVWACVCVYLACVL